MYSFSNSSEILIILEAQTQTDNLYLKRIIIVQSLACVRYQDDLLVSCTWTDSKFSTGFRRIVKYLLLPLGKSQFISFLLNLVWLHKMFGALVFRGIAKATWNLLGHSNSENPFGSKISRISIAKENVCHSARISFVCFQKEYFSFWPALYCQCWWLWEHGISSLPVIIETRNFNWKNINVGLVRFFRYAVTDLRRGLVRKLEGSGTAETSDWTSRIHYRE